MSWYGFVKESQKIISFDFDSTITKPYFNEEEEIWEEKGYRDEIVDLMRQEVSNGNKVIIVTSRLERYSQEVYNAVEELNLPVSGVYFTNSEDKGPTLQRLNVSVHYDDDEVEIQSAEEHGVKAVRVWHPFDLQEKEEEKQELPQESENNLV